MCRYTLLTEKSQLRIAISTCKHNMHAVPIVLQQVDQSLSDRCKQTRLEHKIVTAEKTNIM